MTSGGPSDQALPINLAAWIKHLSLRISSHLSLSAALSYPISFLTITYLLGWIMAGRMYRLIWQTPDRACPVLPSKYVWLFIGGTCEWTFCFCCSCAELQRCTHTMLFIETFVKLVQNVYYLFLQIHLHKMKSNEIIFNHYYGWLMGD